jgi:hypothetical protein
MHFSNLHIFTPLNMSYCILFCEPYYLPTCDLDIAMTTACMSVCKHKPRDDILSDVGGLYFVVTPIVQLTVVGFTKGMTSCLDSIVCTQKLFSTQT